MSSFERGLAQVQASMEKAGKTADEHKAKFESFTQSVERAAKLFASIWVLWESAKDVFSGLGELEKFNIDIAHLTELLQGNAIAASTWMQVAQIMGLDVTQLERSFTALERQMNSGNSPALRQMGISATDASGQLKSVNEVLLESADYFHAHAGASNNAALANELFGKSGYELLPILQQGREGLDNITQMAQKYGLVLSADVIERNLAFTYQLKEGEMAVRGLGISLGNALLPGLSALAEGLSNIISQNLPAFIDGVDRAVSYVLGLVEGLTGMTFTVDDSAMALGALAGATTDLGTQQASAASSAAALADAEQRVRDRAQAATDAIDEQIKTLQDSQNQQKFEDEQAKLKHDSSEQQKNIARLQAEYELALFLNNNVQAQQLLAQLTSAKYQESQTELSITRGQQNEETKAKIAALELQKKGIQDAASDQIREMQRAARGTSDAMNATAGELPILFGKAGQDAGQKFKFAMDSAAEATGKSMGNNILDAALGPEVWVDADRKIQGHFERQGGSMAKVGEAIGNAVGTGITTALGHQFQTWFAHAASQLKSTIGGLEALNVQLAAHFALDPAGTIIEAFAAAFQQAGLSFDEGGTVPGARGAAMLAMVHGRETIRTEEQEAQLQNRLAFGGGLSVLTGGLAPGTAAGSNSGSRDMIEELERLRVGNDGQAELLGQAVSLLTQAVMILRSIDRPSSGAATAAAQRYG